MDECVKSCSVSLMILLRNKLNQMHERKHPWRRLEFLYSAWMAWTRPSSLLKLLTTCHSPTCQTLSNVFLKSMKLWNRSLWCCRCFSIMTTEDLFLANLYPSGPFTCIFSKTSPDFFPALAVANTRSCVGPQNKIGHPAWCRFPSWVPTEYK